MFQICACDYCSGMTVVLQTTVFEIYQNKVRIDFSMSKLSFHFIMDVVEAQELDISSFSFDTHLDPHELVYKMNLFMKGVG